ncbi:MAG: B12-binding domain-containing radical SAM protein [Nitrososphaerales archaeon]
MAKIVLTSDDTLMSNYRDAPLLHYIACAPVEKVPSVLLDFLSYSPTNGDGTAKVAPYGLRKLEASLLNEYSADEVVVAHPEHVEDFIDDDTTTVGVSTMDPLGLGPVSMMFTWGGFFTAYSRKKFQDLVHRINNARGRYPCRLVVGGSGAWQLQLRQDVAGLFGIDNVVVGEVEGVTGELFREIEGGDAPFVINGGGGPKVEDIPNIVHPSVHGMVEAMRGCGRNCRFCDANMRAVRCMPLEKVVSEVKVNVRGGIDDMWVQSDDTFMYMLDDHRNFFPNRDAIIDLFEAIMSTPGVKHSNPTHGSLPPVVADPELIRSLSEVLRAGPDNFIGIQTGVETGSTKLMKKHMAMKTKPYSPEEWCEVVFEGTKVLNQNYWFPAYTLIMGLPGETEEDVWDTVRLIDRLEKELPDKVGGRAHFTVTPLSFVPLGKLKSGEFFNIDEMIDEARFALIYRSWRHTALEISNVPPSVWHNRSILTPPLKMLARVGAYIILRHIEHWGRKRGYLIEKALEVSA